jgi:CRP/FNR family transcriptional regulator
MQKMSSRRKSLDINSEAPCRSKPQVACSYCDFYGFLDLLDRFKDTGLYKQLLKRQQPVAKGENLFRAGQPFHAGYAVNSGAFMSYRLLENGEEQILGFHYPGELFGLDALKSGSYEYSTRALEPGAVCEIDFEDFKLMGGESYTRAQNELIRVLGGQIVEVQRQGLLAAKQSAEERLASFLLDIAQRLAQRGFQNPDLKLSMSRQEIASYLGLAVETVSRMFKRFQSQGLLTASGKRVSLLDMAGLEKVAKAGNK